MQDAVTLEKDWIVFWGDYFLSRFPIVVFFEAQGALAERGQSCLELSGEQNPLNLPEI